MWFLARMAHRFLALMARQFLALMARPLLSVALLPSLCHCISTEEMDALPVMRIVSQTRCIQPILVPPCASIERVGEQTSEIVVRRGTLARVCGRTGFCRLYSQLLASSASVLRHRHRSRDCSEYICLHQVCTTTSNIHSRCLVWMETLMPLVSVALLGTFCFQHLCMFHFCLLLMQLVVHKCTYMSSHTSHWFSRLN
jgi:nitrate reductase NapE component